MTKKQTCLMIKTRDNSTFFTHEKNYPQLIEFGKTFGAELSIVKVDDPPVLDLVSLAPALCTKTGSPKYSNSVEILEVILPGNVRSRKELRKQADTVKRWIRKRLLNNSVVKLSDIANRYKNYNLTLSCFCLHFASVRKELEKEGYTIQKLKNGEYQMKG